MKKKLSSLILVLAMAVGMMATMGITASADGTAVCKIGDVEYATVQAAINQAGTTATTIMMIADSQENVIITENQNITLDLNGCVLKAATEGSAVITIGQENKTAQLIINDSKPNATHTGADESLPAGGVITGGNNDSTQESGGGICNYGTLTMNGGTVTNNNIPDNNGTGGGVYNQGTFTMNAGVAITDNKSIGNGGGVSNRGEKAHFIMNGGTITGNTSSDGSNGGAGGGVYNEGTFEMYGGEISGNTCGTSIGGGVDYGGGSMSTGGTAVIKNNTANNVNCNLYIGSGKLVTIATGTNAPVADKMNIGVTLASGKGQVTSKCTTDYHNYFNSDNTSYGVYNKVEESNNYVYIGNPVEMYKTSDESTKKIYDSVSEAVSTAEANEYNSATILMLSDSEENVSTQGLDCCNDITLDLNGNVLKASSAGSSVITIKDGITLTIKDSNPTATHTGDYADLPAGGVITGAEPKSIRIGTFKREYEGTGITNNGKLNMVGGTVTGNHGYTYAGVNNKGSMTIGGTANITGNTLNTGTTNNLYLPSGNNVTIGTEDNALTNGALIGVTMADGMGQFTANGGKADKQYFSSDNSDYGVAYNENSYLELVDIPVAVKSAGYSASLTLDESIDLNFEMNNLDSGFVKSYFGITVDGETISSDKITSEDSTISCVLKAVEPKDIGEDWQIVITYDGVQVKNFTYSVKDYCDAVFAAYAGDNSTYAKLNTVCEALVNYGKYAEDYANEKEYGAGKYTASTLNENHIIDFGENYIWGTIDLGDTKGTAGYASLDLGSTIKLNYYVKTSTKLINSSETTQNFYLLTTNPEGKEDYVQIDPNRVKAEKLTEGDYNYIVSVDLYASQLADNYILKLKGKDIDNFSINYGVYAYCNAAQDQSEFSDTLKTLCKAIHNYGEAVKSYLN